jgi:dTDP-4-amino-4,6-dideoxygalactose transaminase
VEEAITPRTRAIIPVHLYGQSADMTRIAAIAAKHGLSLVEDCAQAHYATWLGRRVGTFGVAATFSFYPGKNLGAYGDAGAILTGDAELAQRLRMYANHGALRKHEHCIEGVNSRLDAMQAAILSAKLPHIHDWTRARQQVASWYNEALAAIPGITAPRVRSGATHVWHLYVIQIEDRDAVAAELTKRGIQTAVHYPTPLPLLPAYRYLNVRAEQFPAATANAARILSLPMYPELSRQQVHFIAQSLSLATRTK